MNRKIRQIKFPISQTPKLTRVAAYARVSSGKDAMLHSLSAQVSYYSNLIQSHKGWAYVGVYADEALTGTKDNRDNFQRLLTDCRAGKIDLVITKSISRFARNTVTLLETVRELKSLGVNVYFEEQNIYTLSADGELMMTILASYAQEESRSASENQKWRIKANFQAGLPWNGTVLGYRIEDGVYVPKDDEADLVRLIFYYYRVERMGLTKIAKQLNADGYRTRKGNPWTHSTLEKLIRNYAYTGNLLLQTTFIEDHISKKSRINQGQLPMYHATETHEAIIPMDEFTEVAEIRKERAEKYSHVPEVRQTFPFTKKLHCMCCGKRYRRKTVKRGPVWICGTYNTLGKEHCPTSKQIPEDTLMAVSTSVLGLDAFDPDTFTEQIQEVQIGEENALTFVFKDGHTVETVWQDRSRSESWTKEMKAAARETALQQEPRRRHPDGRFKKNESCGVLQTGNETAGHP